MAPPKRYWAKINLPVEFLKTLPHFPTPISKSRLKKIAAEERRALLGESPGGSPNGKASSPTPSINDNGNGDATPTPSSNNNNAIYTEHAIGSQNATNGSTSSNLTTGNNSANNNVKINSGVKEMSTAGLTMNSISSSNYVLDKSGKQCKKWTKKPRSFKTFSGFKVSYHTYRPMDYAEPTIVSKKSDSKNSVGATTIKEESAAPDAIDTSASTPAPATNTV